MTESLHLVDLLSDPESHVRVLLDPAGPALRPPGCAPPRTDVRLLPRSRSLRSAERGTELKLRPRSPCTRSRRASRRGAHLRPRREVEAPGAGPSGSMQARRPEAREIAIQARSILDMVLSSHSSCRDARSEAATLQRLRHDPPPGKEISMESLRGRISRAGAVASRLAASEVGRSGARGSWGGRSETWIGRELWKCCADGPEGVARWNRWRTGQAEAPGLSHADLSRMDLTGANLAGIDLHASNLREAKLLGANLERADLHRAHLGSADLSRAVLRSSNLRGGEPAPGRACSVRTSVAPTCAVPRFAKLRPTRRRVGLRASIRQRTVWSRGRKPDRALPLCARSIGRSLSAPRCALGRTYNRSR